MHFIHSGAKAGNRIDVVILSREGSLFMRKRRFRSWLVLISGIACFVLASCSTLMPLSVGDKELAGEIRDRKFDFFITWDSGPELDKLFKQAIEASLSQDWLKVVGFLKAGYELAPKEKKPIFVNYLFRMADSPFPVATICEILRDLDPPRTAYYQQLLDWAKEGQLTLEWPETAVILPWLIPNPTSSMESSGLTTRFQPIVEVHINGAALRMVLDTGAPRTTLFANSAKMAGLLPVNGLELTMGSSNELSSQPGIALVKSMRIDGLVVKNCQTWIVPRPLGADTYDGLVGWPVLSQLVMELDAHHDRIILSQSGMIRSSSPNYIWLSEPVALVHGGPVQEFGLFLLDTGADRTWFSDSGIRKFRAVATDAAASLSSGINGTQSVPTKIVKTAEFFLDGKQIIFNNHKNIQFNFGFFNFWDGNLGNDIARAGILRLDFPAGRISFEPYRYQVK